MKRIKQVRYYGESDINNSNNITAADLVAGTAFSAFLPIVQLGVQGLPGTRFYLNKSVDPIIIGSTGIYEIELSGETQISWLSFDLESLINIDATPNAVLIVDMIYKGEDVE